MEGGESATAPPPDDALATAALLRTRGARARSRRAGAGRRAHRGLAEARGLAAVDRRRPKRRRWLLPALLVPATAAAALIVTVMPATRSYLAPVARAPVRLVIPKPTATLLEAQANAAHAGGDLSALDRQMRDYRRAYYAAVGGDAEEP